MLTKEAGYSWMVRFICTSFVLVLTYPAFAQIEPPDTLQHKAPEIDTTLENIPSGMDTPGTIIDTFRIQTQAVGHSPRKAALFSAILPGLGQVYNEKYWKIPVIYAGGLALGYAISYQNDRFRVFRKAQLAKENGVESENPLSGTRYDIESTIDRGTERFNRDRDFMVILMAGFYALNIVDAIVDAHLKEFEVNEDLSFRIKPAFEQTAPALSPHYNVGLALTLTFR